MFRIPFIGLFLRALVARIVWRYLSKVLLAGVLGYAGTHAFADTISGRVVGVSDGDTLTVLVGVQQYRVRLQGIDAPESGQAFGSVSKQGLSSLAFGRSVQVEFREQDRYGRILGVVYVDGQDINLAMIKHGLAWHYKHYQRDQSPDKRQTYAAAEKGAQIAQIGVWRDPSPTPPWDFRRGGER